MFIRKLSKIKISTPFNLKYIKKRFKQGVSYLAAPSKNHQQLFYYYSKVLGAIFLVAFFSLASQFNGLFSSSGILPITEAINYFKIYSSWIKLPHVFFISSDIFLWVMLSLGIIASISLIFGLIPMLSTALCWIIYLSFVNTGSVFMSFQWDILLCEVAFFSFFAMPTCLFWKKNKGYCPPRLFIFCARQCCFRLVFFSGLVKLLSQDPMWFQFNALNVHYFTQPLPHTLSWFAHQLPEILDKFCVFLILLIELIVPFFLFSTTKLRHFAATIIIVLMVMIMLTGNYCFFNILTIILACLCFNDSKFNLNKNTNIAISNSSFLSIRLICLSMVIIIALGIELKRFIPMQTLRPLLTTLQRFHIANNYGLFASMTTVRNELEIWASQDKKTWETYSFKYKPNTAQDRPEFVLPHQPRLDWQCWFVALRPFNQNSWVINLVDRLFKKSKAVESLFEKIPFEAPPKHIVLVLRNYEFSKFEQLKSKGNWWNIKEPIQFSPVFSNPYISKN